MYSSCLYFVVLPDSLVAFSTFELVIFAHVGEGEGRGEGCGVSDFAFSLGRLGVQVNVAATNRGPRRRSESRRRGECPSID